MPHKVFISHSSKDKATTDEICAALERQGIEYWIAHRDIPTSSEYDEDIVEAINASTVLLLVFSSNSNKSKDVVTELNLAHKRGLPIITFRMEDVEPTTGVLYYISRLDWLDAFTPPLSAHLKRLTDDVKKLIDDPHLSLPPSPRPKPLPPPARDWKPILIGVGVVLAISIFALWLIYSRSETGRTETDGNRNTEIVKTGDNNSTNTANTANKPPTENVNSTNTSPTKAIGYEEKYRTAIEMLGNNSNQQQRFEGIRLFSEICESGNREWYWKATNHLTTYVRTNARWKSEGARLPDETKEIIAGILQVIAAREPLYPANLTDREKIKMRDLKNTDLRGLRLVITGGAHLEYVDFEGAYLDGSVLQDAHLNYAVMKDSSLRNVDFYKADMTGVDLAGTDLFQANLRQAKGLETWIIGVSPTWHCANLDDSLSNKLRAGKVPTTKCE
jgi:hypothetical protein